MLHQIDCTLTLTTDATLQRLTDKETCFLSLDATFFYTNRNHICNLQQCHIPYAEPQTF